MWTSSRESFTKILLQRDPTGGLVTGFSVSLGCQEEPQIPELTNSSKETGDEHSSEHFNVRQAAA
jgi:hypothetical protein